MEIGVRSLCMSDDQVAARQVEFGRKRRLSAGAGGYR